MWNKCQPRSYTYLLRMHISVNLYVIVGWNTNVVLRETININEIVKLLIAISEHVVRQDICHNHHRDTSVLIRNAIWDIYFSCPIFPETCNRTKHMCGMCSMQEHSPLRLQTTHSILKFLKQEETFSVALLFIDCQTMLLIDLHATNNPHIIASMLVIRYGYSKTH
jgi:hypothetical protein